ncbi:MAG: DnaJ domain-containing protein [Pseudomonadota bacterium]|nr:DnaJ domain-containing protein [Pseudomonadota bacterium]
MPDDLYDDLGVAKDASPEDIKHAYRKRAKREHPDAGGDAERFSKVSRAYMVLSDPERRKRYDETGATEPKRDDTLAKVARIISNALACVMEGGQFDWQTNDLSDAIANEIRVNILELNVEIGATQREMEAAEELRTRFHYKGSKTDIIGGILLQRVQHLERALDVLQQREKSFCDALTYVLEYGYQVDSATRGATSATASAESVRVVFI